MASYLRAILFEFQKSEVLQFFERLEITVEEINLWLSKQ